jgi:hypothetical protein
LTICSLAPSSRRRRGSAAICWCAIAMDTDVSVRGHGR